MSRDLEGKVAVVTGAASGIGRALAMELRARGARLALMDADAPELSKVCEELDAVALWCDVRDDASVATAAKRVREELGPVELLFSNAGVATVGPACEIPVEDARWVLDVNVMGSLIVVRHFVPQMVRAGRGHVTFTASIAGLVGAPGMSAYTASKFAVVGLAESLRVELAGSGVTVTTICPGYVRTGLHRATRYHGRRFAGFLDSTPSWMGMTSAHVARRSVDAAVRGEPQVTLGIEKAAVWLRRLSPSAYTLVASRASQAAGLFSPPRP